MIMQLSSSVPAAFGRLLQVLEEAGELADQEQVDLLELLDLFCVVAVVRQLVVAVVDADHLVGAVAAFVGGHEGDDPRRVGLERQRHQVVHQADVLLTRRPGTSSGVVEVGPRRPALPCCRPG